MKSIVFFTLASLVLSSCVTTVSTPPNTSEQWLPVGENRDGNIISVDTGNFYNSGERYKVWVRIDYTKPQPSQRNATKFYAAFHCKKGTVQKLQELQLDAMGETLEDKPIKMQPEKVNPASTEGMVFEQVCFAKETRTRTHNQELR